MVHVAVLDEERIAGGGGLGCWLRQLPQLGRLPGDGDGPLLLLAETVEGVADAPLHSRLLLLGRLRRVRAAVAAVCHGDTGTHGCQTRIVRVGAQRSDGVPLERPPQHGMPPRALAGVPRAVDLAEHRHHGLLMLRVHGGSLCLGR